MQHTPTCKLAMLAAAMALAMVASGCAVPESARGADSLFAVFAPTSPAQAAQWATDEYNPDLQYRGTILLANASFGGEPPYLELYLDYIDHEDGNVRAAAARGLANHGSPEHALLLAERLGYTEVVDRQFRRTDDDEFVRQECARGLQRLHNPEAVDTLLLAMREPDPTDPRLLAEPNAEVRAAAAHALGQYAEFRVVESLIGYGLADASLTVNRNAREALRTLTGQDLGYDRAAWRAWFGSEENEAPFAARRAYIYPVFRRDRKLIEYLPFVPQPPNEAPSTPVGLSTAELLSESN
ncbi:MAG: HEAT repeat domain-containing protein [Planctomycetota bacterium]